MKYSKLFSPLFIGHLRLKNRIVMAPMATHLADETGAVTPRLIDYYVERACGGVGLIIIESGYVHPSGRGGIRRLGLHEDRLIPGLKELVKQVHSLGAKISAQLHHAGRRTSKGMTGHQPVTPSAIACFKGNTPPREMIFTDPSGVLLFKELTREEIAQLVQGFAQAARRARAAGADAGARGRRGRVV